MSEAFDSLLRRVFLDSSTLQTLQDYGEFTPSPFGLALSTGLSIVKRDDQFLRAITTALNCDPHMCVQQYIEGADAHVPVLVGRALENIESGPPGEVSQTVRAELHHR